MWTLCICRCTLEDKETVSRQGPGVCFVLTVWVVSGVCVCVLFSAGIASQLHLILQVLAVWSICQVAAVYAADPSIVHLMDVTSGNCLETGVVGANGNLTLQPGCNVPNDNQARPLCLSDAGIEAQKAHSRMRAPSMAWSHAVATTAPC